MLDCVKQGKLAQDVYEMPLNVLTDLIEEDRRKENSKRGDAFDMF